MSCQHVSVPQNEPCLGFEIVALLLLELRLLPGWMTASAAVVLIAFQLPPLSTMTYCRFTQRWKEAVSG